jgi:hypothetical protein
MDQPRPLISTSHVATPSFAFALHGVGRLVALPRVHGDWAWASRPSPTLTHTPRSRDPHGPACHGSWGLHAHTIPYHTIPYHARPGQAMDMITSWFLFKIRLCWPFTKPLLFISFRHLGVYIYWGALNIWFSVAHTNDSSPIHTNLFKLVSLTTFVYGKGQ